MAKKLSSQDRTFVRCCDDTVRGNRGNVVNEDSSPALSVAAKRRRVHFWQFLGDDKPVGQAIHVAWQLDDDVRGIVHGDCGKKTDVVRCLQQGKSPSP